MSVFGGGKGAGALAAVVFTVIVEAESSLPALFPEFAAGFDGSDMTDRGAKQRGSEEEGESNRRLLEAEMESKEAVSNCFPWVESTAGVEGSDVSGRKQRAIELEGTCVVRLRSIRVCGGQ